MYFTNIDPRTTWVIDIETRDNARAEEFHKEFTDKKIKAKANLVDPAKIEADIAKKKAEAREKNAVHWITGAVASIALIRVEDGMKKTSKKKVLAWAGLNEKAILEELIKVMNTEGVFVLCGKNSCGFDFPFLIGRIMANSLPMPQQFTNKNNLLDVDKIFATRGMDNQDASLNKYLFGLGIKAKIMKGSYVPTLCKEALVAQAEGNTARYVEIMTSIKEYNIDDTIKTARILGRFVGLKDENK
jgi:hypothetical protein